MTVLSIGAGAEQANSIKIAQSLGLDVIACDGDNNASAKDLADSFYHIDIKDEEAVIQLAKKYNISFILPSPLGRYLTTVGAVNDALLLKGISKESATICVDKYIFNQKLNKEILLAKQFLIHNLEDLKFLLKEDKISFPIILKPRFGSGSRGIRVFKNWSEEIELYFKEEQNDDILVEEFFEGDEIGVDAIVRDGTLEVIAIRDKQLTPLPYRQEISYSMPSKYLNKKTEIVKIIQKIVNITNLDNTLINLDILMNNNTPIVIEVAPRASGNNISHTFLPYSIGINPIEIMIKSYLSTYIKIPTKITPTYFEFFNFPHHNDSYVLDVKLFDNISNLVQIDCKLKKNTTIKEIKSGNDAMSQGYFILQGEELDINKSKKEIYEKIILEKNIEEENKKAWSKVINDHVMLYPDTYIVSFLARNFPNKEENRDLSALDIGFGSGRNLKLLIDYGFNSYGIDYSKDACDIAKKLFSLNDEIISCKDLRENPFQNKKFDLILAYGLIFLRPIQEMKTDLKILFENLKNGGKMIINFRTKDDFLYKRGEQIDEHTYILNHPSYKNMCYTFLSQKETEDLLLEAGFILENLSRVDYHKNNLSEHHSWWIAEVVKP